MHRPRGATSLVAAIATGVAVACSSFGSSDEPRGTTPPDEAGIEGGPLEEGGSKDGTTCDANVATDPANCGRCGHDCKGGTCAGGRCQPLQLAQFSDQPVANVVLSRTHVFFNTMADISGGTGNVYSCAKPSCAGGVSILPVGAQTVRGLGSDGDQKVFGGAFYNSGGLFELGPKTVTTKVSSAEAGNPFHMSVRADFLHWISFYEPEPTNGRTVRSIDALGSITTRCVLSASVTTSAGAFTASRVYLHSNSTGVLFSCPLDSTDAAFVQNRTNIDLASLTATDDRIFWAESGSVVSSADGPTSATARAEVGPTDVGSDVTSVTATGGALFMTTKNGELWSCPFDDCKNKRQKVAVDGALETFHPYVSHTVAADSESVYFVAVDGRADGGTQTMSRLMRVTR